MSMFRSKAIKKVHPEATTINSDKEARDEDWNLIELNWTKIEEEEQKLLKDYNSKKYQRDRLQEYPSIQECIHAILDNDLDALQVKRTAVKAKYPKPE